MLSELMNHKWAINLNDSVILPIPMNSARSQINLWIEWIKNVWSLVHLKKQVWKREKISSQTQRLLFFLFYKLHSFWFAFLYLGISTRFLQQFSELTWDWYVLLHSQVFYLFICIRLILSALCGFWVVCNDDTLWDMKICTFLKNWGKNRNFILNKRIGMSQHLKYAVITNS